MALSSSMTRGSDPPAAGDVAYLARRSISAAMTVWTYAGVARAGPTQSTSGLARGRGTTRERAGQGCRHARARSCGLPAAAAARAGGCLQHIHADLHPHVARAMDKHRPMDTGRCAHAEQHLLAKVAPLQHRVQRHAQKQQQHVRARVRTLTPVCSCGSTPSSASRVPRWKRSGKPWMRAWGGGGGGGGRPAHGREVVGARCQPAAACTYMARGECHRTTVR